MDSVFTPASVTVAKDGSGNYQTIQQAIVCASKNKSIKKIIVYPGVYEENIRIYNDGLTLIGIGDVRIEGNWSAKDVLPNGELRGTFQTATVFINAKDVTLEGITIKNTAGPDHVAAQAVALYIEGTNVTINRCSLDAYQDTLCLGPLPTTNKDETPLKSPWRSRVFSQQLSYFNECTISGTIDFIFGGGQALFTSCHIYSRKRATVNYLTAASTPKRAEGFIFMNCQISGESPYYLGRPWRDHAKTRFEKCIFDKWLTSAGWHDWDKETAQKTVCYKEVDCTYAIVPQRASWMTLEGAKINEKKT